MNDDKAQAALATLCRYVQKECRDETLDRLRKQRHAATQRAHIAKRKLEAIQLEVAVVKASNTLLLYQITKLRHEAAVVNGAFSR